MLFPRIPAEICASICAEVEPVDLVALCRTSRLFRDEAQRILYHTVDLQGRPMRSLRSWALAVTRHSHLGERVHALSLELPETLKLSASDGMKIKRALRACINLKELKVSCEEDFGPNVRPDASSGWMVNEASFRLTKFANTYFSSRSTTKFWDAQSEIRVLSIPHIYGFPFADEQLPNLIAIGGLQLYSLPVGRPLQRIETCFHPDFSPIARFSQTLTTLNIVQTILDHNSTLADTVTSIVDLLPALVHFGIAELEQYVRRPFRYIHLTKFKNSGLRSF